jgi:hypothetical protein
VADRGAGARWQDGGQGVGYAAKGGRGGLLPERGGLPLPAHQPARANDARHRLPGRADERQAPVRAVAGATRGCAEGLHARRARRGRHLGEARLRQGRHHPRLLQAQRRVSARLHGAAARARQAARPRAARPGAERDAVEHRRAGRRAAAAGVAGARAHGAHARRGQEAGQGAAGSRRGGQGRGGDRGRRAQSGVGGASQRPGADGVRAVRARRRAPLLRGDRARRLRAARLDRIAGVLRQCVPRAAREPPHRGRQARDGRGAQGLVRQAAVRGGGQLLLGVAFLHNGFRRTGLLVDHLVVGGERKDAILWSRKLANPAGE